MAVQQTPTVGSGNPAELATYFVENSEPLFVVVS
jgi:hypothetical protein